MKFKVALLQIKPRGNDHDKNLEAGLRYCRDAKALSADLAVFPELWSIGGGLGPATDQRSRISAAIDRDHEFFRSFAAAARELEMNIAITYLESFRPKPRNSVSILDGRGEVALHYSKVCICDFPASADDGPGCDVGCSPGETFPVCTLTGAQGEVEVGAMICADREFPEPATQLMLNGAELIVIPNACDWDDARSAGLLTRAFDNLLGVAMANYPRPQNNGNSRAYTCVNRQNGRARNPLLAVAGEAEELLLAEFDLHAIRKFRQEEAWRLEYRNQLWRARSDCS